jgi:CHAD domain-containing protein
MSIQQGRKGVKRKIVKKQGHRVVMIENTEKNRNVGKTKGAKGGVRVRTLQRPVKTRVPQRPDAVRLVSVALDNRLGVCMARLHGARTRASETAIHDLRVSLRRLIAALDLAGDIVPDPGIPALRRKLRKILKQFNALRDVHISLLAMTEVRASAPSVRSYILVLQRQERILLRECVATLKGIDMRGLERAVATVQQSLFATGADPALAAAMPAVVAGSMARTSTRALRALKDVNTANPSTIHTLRVAFKKVRYAAEILTPLLPWMTRSRRKWMQEYQTRMGEVQDCEVMIAGVRRYAAAPSPSMSRRVSMLAVQELLARRKREALAAFMHHAGELENNLYGNRT